MLCPNQTFATQRSFTPIVALIQHWTKGSTSMRKDRTVDGAITPPEVTGRKKYYLGKKYANVYFTAQEARYMYYALKNFRNKKIVEMMQLSPRTGSWYCENMRHKIGAKHKKDMVRKIKRTDFMHYVSDLAQQEGC